MTKKDFLIIPMIALLVIPVAVTIKGWWLVTVCAILAVVAIIEAISYAKGRQTISQRWELWAELNPLKAWLVVASVALGMICLFLHLMYDLIF